MDAIKEVTTIKLSVIDMDASARHCQIRGCTDSAVVEEYAAQMLESIEFPPIHIFTDRKTNWLVDGFHRVEAAADAGLEELPCIVHEGSLRDAILFAVGANAHHGLRRSNADKRRSVQTLLDDDAWSKWSDRKIARQCGVSQPFVSAMRKEGDNGYHPEEELEPVQGDANATTEDARPLVDEPSSVPGELDEWNPDEADEEAPRPFVDDPGGDGDEPPPNKFGAFYDLVKREVDKVLVDAEPHEYFVLAMQLQTIAEEIEHKGRDQ